MINKETYDYDYDIVISSAIPDGNLIDSGIGGYNVENQVYETKFCEGLYEKIEHGSLNSKKVDERKMIEENFEKRPFDKNTNLTKQKQNFDVLINQLVKDKANPDIVQKCKNYEDLIKFIDTYNIDKKELNDGRKKTPFFTAKADQDDNISIEENQANPKEDSQQTSPNMMQIEEEKNIETDQFENGDKEFALNLFGHRDIKNFCFDKEFDLCLNWASAKNLKTETYFRQMDAQINAISS